MFSGIKLFHFLFVGLSLFLAINSSVDIWFTEIFYKGNNQFFVQHYLVSKVYFYEFFIRDVFLPLIVIFLLFFPIVIKFSRYLKNKFILFDFKTTDICFIWASTIIMTFVISFLLKDLWGRARPVDTIAFGGEKVFTPWWVYSTECLDNCSFVSGDASVGFFIACIYYITNNIKFFYISILFGLIIGIVRVGAGAHFLSDVLMSFVVINVILKLTHYMFSKWIKTKA